LQKSHKIGLVFQGNPGFYQACSSKAPHTTSLAGTRTYDHLMAHLRLACIAAGFNASAEKGARENQRIKKVLE